MQEMEDLTLDEALDLEYRCEVCKEKIDNDEYPVCDECSIEAEKDFDVDAYQKQLEKEFSGESIPELEV